MAFCDFVSLGRQDEVNGTGFKLILFFFFGCTVEGGILVPRPGMEPELPVLGAWSLNLPPGKSLSSFLGWRNGHKEVQ